MKVTALDIHQKEFGHGMRGYKEDEVDDFLDAVATEVDRLTRETAALTERTREAEAKAAGLDAERNAINSALLIAQRSADEMMAKAEDEVAKIINEAELKASQIVHEALASKRELLGEIKRLKDEEVRFRSALNRMVEGTLQSIDEITLSASVIDDLEGPEVEIAVAEQVAAAPTPEFTPQVSAPTPAPAPVTPAPVAAPAPASDVSGMMIGEVNAQPPVDLNLLEPSEFKVGSTSVWGEPDDDIEIEEID